MKLSLNTKSGLAAMRSAFNNENGAALVIGLMFIAILGLLGSTAVVLTTTDMQIGANYRANAQAFNNAEAGIDYAIWKVEDLLKSNPDTTLPTETSPPSTELSTFFATDPAGYEFSYPSDIEWVAEDTYKFTSEGTGPLNSFARVEVACKRLPAIKFAAFGDNKLEMKNTSGVYSYSHTDTPSPTPADTTFQGDIGSNNNVILNMDAVISGDAVVGETLAGTRASYTDHGADIAGEENLPVPRVDPDPLEIGIPGGMYATKLAGYAITNDNGTAIGEDNYYTTQTLGVGTTISLGNKETLTLKGTATGANFYFTDINLASNSVLFIDTTDGAVNIYLAGAMNVANGAEVVNLEKPGTGCVGTSGECDCATIGPPKFDCLPCYAAPYEIGAPSNFSIFSNSTSGISIGNSVDFSGLIYAPYAQVRFDNSVTIYGAVWGYDVEIVANTILYFDTDLMDMDSNEVAVTLWRDHRMD